MSSSQPESGSTAQPESLNIAWISRGRLFVRRGTEPAREVESEFARKAIEREIRDSQLNSWKGRSGIWGNMGIQPPGTVPWEDVEARRRIRFAALAPGESPDHICYVLDMGVVGGLFSYDLSRDEERRLVHRQGFVARDLSRHPVDGQLALSLPREDGTVGLKITRHDGLFGSSATVSDSLDETPRWLPDGTHRLVFQSSTIGRNEHGIAVGQTTWRIEMLDVGSGQTTTVHEEEHFDLLQPVMTSDESLICIRRPYQAVRRNDQTFLQFLTDVVLFPYRLARTFVYFFHFLSVMFSGRPLISSGGPDQPNSRTSPVMMLWGQAIDTKRFLNRKSAGSTGESLVPRDWQLIRRRTDGTQETLAEGVLAFDVDPGGQLVYTNGRAIFRLSESGAPEVIHQGELIERVIILR